MECVASFPVLNGFITLGGTIDLGRIGTAECAAIAADEQTVWVVLLRREGETLMELLDRLERRLTLCLMHGVPYDEPDWPVRAPRASPEVLPVACRPVRDRRPASARH